MRDELFALHAALTADVLDVAGLRGDAGERIDAWEVHGAERVERFRAMMADIATVAEPDLAMLSVVVREMRGLIMSPEAATRAAGPPSS